MALSTQPYKGARDFYPEDKRLQKYIFHMWRKAVERFGYEEYDAPILEPLELYAAKTGDEIVNEQTYTFTDRGDRQVVIRPEMTPTVSRMVAARRQDLPYPLRWYSIPNLWRYERPQRGRLREHWQLNVDVFGIADQSAEIEIISVADSIMREFKAKREMYTIRLNSRVLVNALLHDYLGLDEVQSSTLMKLIDRMHKIDHAEFVGQVDALFHPSQRDSGASDKLLAILNVTSLSELPESLRTHKAALSLSTLIQELEASGIRNVHYDPTLMRGFDYYTDVVFEVFDTNPENSRSMFGGGRYDGLVSLFGVEAVPTAGFGMGDVTLANFLETHELVPSLRSETDAFVIAVGNVSTKIHKVVAELREMGLNVAEADPEQKTDKQIKIAVKKGVRYAIFVGDKELESEQFVLKDLDTGNEETHGLQRLVSIVKDYRKT
jgi:histidyl-tRNA synthetase